MTSLGSALTTPSHWLRVSLLKFLSYLPHPTLQSLESIEKKAEKSIEKSNKNIKNSSHITTDDSNDNEEEKQRWDLREKREEERSVDIALLCLEAACTPAELRAEREFARRASKLETHVRSGRLPAPYVRVICSVCLGAFEVAFFHSLCF